MIPAPGWYRQQLIKLAATAEVDTEFALVLDADVIAVRSISDSELIVDGRALRPKGPMKHPEWAASAARVLRMNPIDYEPSVTPSVLSREVIRQLATYATTSLRPRRLQDYAKATRRAAKRQGARAALGKAASARVRVAAVTPGLRHCLTGWRGCLLAQLPWTEYQLYDTFLAGTSSFEAFHYSSDDQLISGNSLMSGSNPNDWTPGPSIDGPSFGFSVVQSRTAIPVPVLEARLRAANLLFDGP
jgi:hypothetical protein